MHFPLTGKLWLTAWMHKLVKTATWLTFVVCVGSTASTEEYRATAGVTGTITAVGSETMSNLLAMWAEGFKQHYPHVKFQLQAAGSSTAPPALTEGTANLGSMSRGLTQTERNHFRQKNGYDATLVPVALDAITLFVDIDNPVTQLDQVQIDAIFSTTRFCGNAIPIDSWEQLGIDTDKGKIFLYGRNAVSGTYGLFKKLALCGGDFKVHVNELPSSASVVQSVAYSTSGIGYAGYGFQSAGVKKLAINNGQGDYVSPTEPNIARGDYPFSRPLHFLVNKSPDSQLPKLVLEFLRFVLSEQGSQITRKEGYVPLLPFARAQSLRKVDAADRAYTHPSS